MSASQATLQMVDTHSAEKAMAKHFHQKGAHQERSSGHITAFSEEDMGFIGRKKSIHNLLTEGFSVRFRVGLLYTCYISLFLDMCVTTLYY